MKTILSIEELNDVYSLALSGSRLGLWHWDLTTNNVRFDRRWLEMIGLEYETAKMEYATWEERVHPDDLEQALIDIKDHVEGRTEFYLNVHRMKHSDGHWVYIQDRGKISRYDENGKPIFFTGTHLDITEEMERKQKFEKQQTVALQQSKLASIGQLAAGVGHEINNPLAVILGFTGFIKNKLNSDQEFSKEDVLNQLEKIEIAAKRIGKITNGLRALSRESSSEFNLFSPKKALLETLDLIEKLFESEGVKVFHNLLSLEGEPLIYGSVGHFHEVIINLLTNSKDAVKNSKNKDILLEIKNQGDHLLISIKDHGSGIPAEIIPNIFDPFFSTKDVNEGTGLGLSLVHNHINELRGEITVESEVDVGTTFFLKIPTKGQNTSLNTNPEIDSSKPDNRKQFNYKVLIAEDESNLREIITMMLQHFGCEVLEATDGREALSLIEENIDSLDLIISDLKMPRVDGLTLLKIYRDSYSRETSPKFVVTTGDTNVDYDDKNSFIAKNSDGLLLKPFTDESLLNILKKV